MKKVINWVYVKDITEDEYYNPTNKILYFNYGE